MLPPPRHRLQLLLRPINRARNLVKHKVANDTLGDRTRLVRLVRQLADYALSFALVLEYEQEVPLV